MLVITLGFPLVSLLQGDVEPVADVSPELIRETDNALTGRRQPRRRRQPAAHPSPASDGSTKEPEVGHGGGASASDAVPSPGKKAEGVETVVGQRVAYTESTTADIRDLQEQTRHLHELVAATTGAGAVAVPPAHTLEPWDDAKADTLAADKREQFDELCKRTKLFRLRARNKEQTLQFFKDNGWADPGTPSHRLV